MVAGFICVHPRDQRDIKKLIQLPTFLPKFYLFTKRP